MIFEFVSKIILHKIIYGLDDNKKQILDIVLLRFNYLKNNKLYKICTQDV